VASPSSPPPHLPVPAPPCNHVGVQRVDLERKHLMGGLQHTFRVDGVPGECERVGVGAGPGAGVGGVGVGVGLA